mmetsp:Transcript_19756/g.48485  ORF Transcript_19756/g.48485 Transcript_19756/m.48485 type:complete len:377 (-) Transcript_19756:662-1792(-)
MAICHPAMAGLKEPLERFFKTSGGAVDAIAELLAVMSEEPPPPPKELLETLGITPDDIKAAAEAKKPVVASRSGLDKAVEDILDGAVPAKEYVERVTKHTDKIELRISNNRNRAAFKFSEEEAAEVEERLLTEMEEDNELQKTRENLRKVHDDWRAEEDVTDPHKFPTVTVGPEILKMETLFQIAQRKLFHTPEQRAKCFINDVDDPAIFALEKLLEHRTKEGGPVGKIQMKRIIWLAKEITGVEVRTSDLEDHALMKKLDETIESKLTDNNFITKVEKACMSKKTTDPREKVKNVEALLSKTLADAGKTVGLEQGYYTLVLLSVLHSLQIERLKVGVEPLDCKAQVAISTVRTRTGAALFGRGPPKPAGGAPPNK